MLCYNYYNVHSTFKTHFHKSFPPHQSISWILDNSMVLFMFYVIFFNLVRVLDPSFWPHGNKNRLDKWLIHSFIDWFIYWLIRSFIHSFIHSFILYGHVTVPYKLSYYYYYMWNSLLTTLPAYFHHIIISKNVVISLWRAGPTMQGRAAEDAGCV